MMLSDFQKCYELFMPGNILWIICVFFCMLPFRIHEKILNADAPEYGNFQALLRCETFWLSTN